MNQTELIQCLMAIFISVFIVGMLVMNVYIPDDYDELVEYYLAAVDVAREYQALCEAAEANVDRLLTQVDALTAECEYSDDLAAAKEAEIESLKAEIQTLNEEKAKLQEIVDEVKDLKE